jgi:hypothetical protein
MISANVAQTARDASMDTTAQSHRQSCVQISSLEFARIPAAPDA